MQVVILAAGENSRFFPLNATQNKGAISLLGKPLIVRTLESLKTHGATSVIIVIGHRDEAEGGLKERVETAAVDIPITFVSLEAGQGMGNALLAAKDHLEERFAVIGPYQINAGELLEKMWRLSPHNVLSIATTNEPWNYGIVTLDGDRITGVVEKPTAGTEPSNFKLLSIYVLNQNYLKNLVAAAPEHYSFEVALNQLFQQESVPALKIDDNPLTLKYAWHIFDVVNRLFTEMPSFTSPTAKVAETAVIDESHGPVFIEAGAVVGHAAKVVGPCYLGKNTLVGDFSFVRGSVVEEKAQVGANTEVVRSVLFEGSTLHYGYLADSILGRKVKVGAGLITANKRLDRQNIQMHIKDAKIDAGRNALGIIVGDKASLGIRVSTMPGICIAAESQIYPGVTLTKNTKYQEIVTS
jgi:NDP-sugar pyrophosphorylase family protein